MNTIYKYRIDPNNELILMKKGAKILSVEGQLDEIFLWAMVDAEQPDEERRFFTFGTGNILPEDMSNFEFIGTSFLLEDSLVLHTFEQKKSD